MSTVISPTEYVIRTRFETGGEIPGLKGITSQLGGISSQISGIGTAITGAFAGVASLQGIRTLVSGIVGLHTEVQNAELGIASLFSSLGGAAMPDAIRLSKSLLKDLQRDAATGVGELSDYTAGIQNLLGPGLGVGKSVGEIRELNRLALTAGFALRGQEGLKLVGFDMQQAMTQGTGDRTTPIVNQALRSIGVTNKAFNDMSSAKRWETLTKAFGTFGAAADEMGKSWDAQSATFTDNLKSIVRTATEPLFEGWTSALSDANKWLEKNRNLMTEMAERIAPRLRAGWEGARANAGGIASSGVGLAVGGVGLRGGTMVAGAVGAVGGAGALLAGGVAAFVGFIGVAVTTAVQKVDWLRGYLAGSFYQLTEAFFGLGRRLAQFASSPIMTWIGTVFGATVGFFLNVLTVFVRGLNTFIDMVSVGLDMWMYALKGVGAFLSGDLVGASAAKGNFDILATKQQDLFMKAFDDMEILNNLTAPPVLSSGGVDEVGGKDGSGLKPPPNINIDKVEIKAERMDDPAMVATSFERLTEYLNKYPRTTTAGGSTRAR